MKVSTSASRAAKCQVQVCTKNRHASETMIAHKYIAEPYHCTEENNRDGAGDHDSIAQQLCMSRPSELHKTVWQKKAK